MPPFETAEYLARIAKTKQRMAERGIEVLLVADPANMNYLTGYNGWSFYTPQLVVLAEALGEPFCIVRGLDDSAVNLGRHAVREAVKWNHIRSRGEDRHAIHDELETLAPLIRHAP